MSRTGCRRLPRNGSSPTIVEPSQMTVVRHSRSCHVRPPPPDERSDCHQRVWNGGRLLSGKLERRKGQLHPYIPLPSIAAGSGTRVRIPLPRWAAHVIEHHATVLQHASGHREKCLISVQNLRVPADVTRVGAFGPALEATVYPGTPAPGRSAPHTTRRMHRRELFGRHTMARRQRP